MNSIYLILFFDTLLIKTFAVNLVNLCLKDPLLLHFGEEPGTLQIIGNASKHINLKPFDLTLGMMKYCLLKITI